MLDALESATAGIIQRCEDLFGDLRFEAARAWKAAQPGRKVIGYMPYYTVPGKSWLFSGDCWCGLRWPGEWRNRQCFPGTVLRAA
jgi:hypothetical protein